MLAFFVCQPTFREPFMETYYDYLRAHAPELGARIVETYPALQTPKSLTAPELGSLIRRPLPAQALAITGLAK
jgi:hypothetical protein